MQSLQERMEDATLLFSQARQYDPRLARLEGMEAQQRIQAWTAMLLTTNLRREELSEGLLRTYRSATTPLNPIASIISEARSFRSSRPYQAASQGVYDAPQLTTSGGSSSRAIMACYAGVLDAACPACGATPGTVCRHDSGVECRVPHRVRVRAARELTAALPAGAGK